MTLVTSPRVSIGLPVRNGEQYITQAIESLLTQSFTDFELIICDNASTDKTAQICAAYHERDRRVRFCRNERDLGISGNFNKVFTLARGQYFKWAAADDICLPGLVASCVTALDEDATVVLAYTRTRFIDKHGTFLSIEDPGWNLTSDMPHERLHKVLVSRHLVNLFYGLIRADSLSKTRMFPTYPGGDYRLIAELALQGRIVEIADSQFLRRLHDGSVTQQFIKARVTNGFYPISRQRVRSPTWQLEKDLWVTALKAEIELRHKWQLSYAVAKRLYWSRWEIIKELLGCA